MASGLKANLDMKRITLKSALEALEVMKREPLRR